jgi:hypothetical protein
MRQTLEEIRKSVVPRVTIPRTMREDLAVLRNVIERNMGYLDVEDFETLSASDGISADQISWAEELNRDWRARLDARRRRPRDSRASHAAAESSSGSSSDESAF